MVPYSGFCGEPRTRLQLLSILRLFVGSRAASRYGRVYDDRWSLLLARRVLALRESPPREATADIPRPSTREIWDDGRDDEESEEGKEAALVGWYRAKGCGDASIHAGLDHKPHDHTNGTMTITSITVK